jgi:hypothetical protein
VTNDQLLALKGGAPGYLVIDDLVQLLERVIGKPECLGDLESWIRDILTDDRIMHTPGIARSSATAVDVVP